MALAITYINQQESWMTITLQTGDTLAAGGGYAAVPGPTTLFFPVDVGNRYYAQAQAAGLIATATKPARPPKPV
jgi:hypothetical protein